MSCACRICERHRRIVGVIRSGSKAVLRAELLILLDDLEHVEMDRDVCNAVIDGSWPSADDALAFKRSQRHAATQTPPAKST